jgi:tetratricopeptide (TPR) repeat protein
MHMPGLIAQKNGRPERAVRLLIKAAKLDARRPEILCDLGNAFKSLSRHKDAIKAHRMVLTMLPNSPDIGRKRGGRVMGNIPSIKIDAAPGELIEKITILEIKAERIDDAMKCANVTYELATSTNALNLAVETSEQISDLSTRLKAVNERLWETEDSIRACKNRQDFGPVFIDLARSVYRLDDVRADIKRSINMLLGARIIEEKAYTDY